jgi:protein CpxP
MEKTKLLTISVIGLLIINFGTLGFLLLSRNGNRPPHGGRPEPKEVIIDKLHFDKEQQKEYAKLIQWHRGEITKLDGNIRRAKNELYSQLNLAEVDVVKNDSLIDAILYNQREIEEVHFKHFQDIKKLCNKDQIDDFNALTEELSRIFAPKPHGPRND